MKLRRLDFYIAFSCCWCLIYLTSSSASSSVDELKSDLNKYDALNRLKLNFFYRNNNNNNKDESTPSFRSNLKTFQSKLLKLRNADCSTANDSSFESRLEKSLIRSSNKEKKTKWISFMNEWYGVNGTRRPVDESNVNALMTDLDNMVIK